MKKLLSAIAFASLCAPTAALAAPFSYLPPGDLIPGSGQGRVDNKVYAPGMRFPIEAGPAFANSQVWGAGGSQGPGGGQCDTINYDYPWRDNYCETRQWDMPLCPAGTGHQGQDIRPSTCQKDVHWTVAAVDGTITSIGSYSVYLTAADGTRYDYLHMSQVQVSVGQKVTRGQRIGKVSNEFGGTPTTIHLHFNLRQNIAGIGSVYVPPYLSLIEAYQALIGPVSAAPKGNLDAADCDGIRGWTQDPDTPMQASAVELWFDGAPGDLDAQAVTLPADRYRDDLCTAIGSCEHGYETELPLSLRDNLPHTVRAYGMDTQMGPSAELSGSPQTFTCSLTLPEGVRRQVADYESFLAWKFSAFWDVATLSDAALEAIPKGDALPIAPHLVRADDGSPDVWLLDGDLRRPVPTPEVAAAWEMDLGANVDSWPKSEILALPEGTAVRSRPFLIKGSGATVYLIDDPQGTGSSGSAGGTGGAGGGASFNGDDVAEAACSCSVVGESQRGVGFAGLGAFMLGLAVLVRRKRRWRLGE